MKKRGAKPRITLDQAKEMRRVWRGSDTLRLADMAPIFGFDRGTIGDILRGFRHPDAVGPDEPKNLIKERRERRRQTV